MHKKLLAVLAGLVILVMAAPAQAREHRNRRHNRRPLIQVRVNNPFHYGHYRYYPRYYGTPIWTGLHQWQNEMRVNLAISSRAHNRSICERHLDRYGWDSVAETRCPAAGISYEDYLRATQGTRPEASESSRAPEPPEEAQETEYKYSEPARPQERESAATAPQPPDTGELWVNMTGCPVKVDGTDVPPEGLRVRNPETAQISVLAKRATCRATALKAVAPGVTGIVCR